jgi:hypothetical protein
MIRTVQTINGVQPKEWMGEKELLKELSLQPQRANRQDNRAQWSELGRQMRRQFKAKVRAEKRARLDVKGNGVSR